MIGLTLALVVAVKSPPQPQYLGSTVDTTMVLNACNAPRRMLAADFCGGYVLATFDALAASFRICPVAGAATQSAMGVAIRYLNDHPEKWSLAPSYVLTEAFTAAYPCR